MPLPHYRPASAGRQKIFCYSRAVTNKTAGSVFDTLPAVFLSFLLMDFYEEGSDGQGKDDVVIALIKTLITRRSGSSLRLITMSLQIYHCSPSLRSSFNVSSSRLTFLSAAFCLWSSPANIRESASADIDRICQCNLFVLLSVEISDQICADPARTDIDRNVLPGFR